MTTTSPIRKSCWTPCRFRPRKGRSGRTLTRGRPSGREQRLQGGSVQAADPGAEADSIGSRESRGGPEGVLLLDRMDRPGFQEHVPALSGPVIPQPVRGDRLIVVDLPEHFRGTPVVAFPPGALDRAEEVHRPLLVAGPFLLVPEEVAPF